MTAKGDNLLETIFGKSKDKQAVLLEKRVAAENKELMLMPAPRIMALTVWGEARGEGSLGMAAVAWVIMNRAHRGGWWGDSIKSVCLKPMQFSCWNANDPNRSDLLTLADDLERNKDNASRHPALSRAKEICRRVLDRKIVSPVRDATHYHTEKVNPSWAKSDKMQYIRQIGAHLFYVEC